MDMCDCSICDNRRHVLSAADMESFRATLENPPTANPKLQEAMRKLKDVVRVDPESSRWI